MTRPISFFDLICESRLGRASFAVYIYQCTSTVMDVLGRPIKLISNSLAWRKIAITTNGALEGPQLEDRVIHPELGELSDPRFSVVKCVGTTCVTINEPVHAQRWLVSEPSTFHQLLLETQVRESSTQPSYFSQRQTS